MSVLVKDMEMPQGSCEWVDKDCHLHRCKLLNSDDDCKMQEGLCSTITWQEQFANCPLIEVPTPHGRLIDKDKLRRELFLNFNGERIPFYDCDNFPTTLTYRDLHSILSEQPTIIETEGSEE